MSDSTVHPALLARWQMPSDVTAFVDLAALDEREATEHRPHGGGDGFGAVDHHQQATGEVETSFDQIGQQRLYDGGELDVAMPQRDGHLGAID